MRIITIENAVASSLRQKSSLNMILASIMTTVVVMLSCIDPVIRTYRENFCFVEGFYIDLLTKGFQSDILSSFLPILAALPFGGCFVDDMKSKFVRFILIRGRYNSYIISRIIGAFLLGGMAILSGALIAWGTIATALIPIERGAEDIEVTAIDDLINICFLLFVNGGLWPVVGMAMSTLMESQYIAYASPFVIYYLLVILCERYFPDAYLLYPPNWTNPDVWPYGVWGAAAFLLELTLVFSFLFVIRAGRRLREL